MTNQPDDQIDWSLTTWKGSRREQHREFHALPFRRKLELIEEMGAQVAQMKAARHNSGRPYIDPDTGEPVAGTRQLIGAVEEPPAPPPPSSPPPER